MTEGGIDNPRNVFMTGTGETMNWTIKNARVPEASGVTDRDIPVAGGLIADRADPDAPVFDAAGGLVLPGIVDLHGDAFERALQPRAGVRFSTDAALDEVDRQVVASGITTVFHAITVSWEGSIRSLETAGEIVAAVRSGDFLAATYPHIRWEIFATDAVDEVLDWLGRSEIAMLSLNDHTTAFLHLEPPSPKLDRLATRMGVSVGEVQAILREQAAREAAVPEAVKQMCRAAGTLGVPVLAHDERSAEERRRHRALGVTVCEFPVTRDAAQDAAEAGEPILLGAPNVVRGGSHTGAINAADAISAGLGTVLVSDYHYPSLMQAAFKLAGPDHGNLFESWKLVSRAPALAAGLDDRGAIAAGLRGDMLVFWPRSTTLRAVFVGGRKVVEYG